MRTRAVMVVAIVVGSGVVAAILTQSPSLVLPLLAFGSTVIVTIASKG